MSRVSQIATNEAQLLTGRPINDNYYVVSLLREPVVQIAHKIGRKPTGVYHKLGVWALRVKDKTDKAQLDAIFGKPGGQTSLVM